MRLAFYFDEHVPWPVAHGLRSLGIDVLRLQDDGFAGRDDEPVLDRATELGRVLFTHDDDFLVISAEWLRIGRAFAGIAYVHQDRLSYRERIDGLARIAREYSAEEVISRVIYLPFPRRSP